LADTASGAPRGGEITVVASAAPPGRTTDGHRLSSHPATGVTHDLRPQYTMCIRRAQCVYDPSTTTQRPRRTPPVAQTINRRRRRRSPPFVALK